MSNQELSGVKGGATFNASFLNALSRTMETIYNIGRSLGSSLKMIIFHQKC